VFKLRSRFNVLSISGNFPPLQARMKSVMAREMEVVVKEEK